MKKSELKAITAKGEDSRLQFKQDILEEKRAAYGKEIVDALG